MNLGSPIAKSAIGKPKFVIRKCTDPYHPVHLQESNQRVPSCITVHSPLGYPLCASARKLSAQQLSWDISRLLPTLRNRKPRDSIHAIWDITSHLGHYETFFWDMIGHFNVRKTWKNLKRHDVVRSIDWAQFDIIILFVIVP